VLWCLGWKPNMNRSICFNYVLQVPAPNHLRPLPGDDGEDSDGKAAQFHLRAVCNGERFSRLHRHQPLHDVLRQQLRQRDTYELSQRLACQNFMYVRLFISTYALLLNVWIEIKRKPFLDLMFIYSFVSLTHWTDRSSFQMSETACPLVQGYVTHFSPIHSHIWLKMKRITTSYVCIYIYIYIYIYAMTFWYM